MGGRGMEGRGMRRREGKGGERRGNGPVDPFALEAELDTEETGFAGTGAVDQGREGEGDDAFDSSCSAPPCSSVPRRRTRERESGRTAEKLALPPRIDPPFPDVRLKLERNDQHPAVDVGVGRRWGIVARVGVEDVGADFDGAAWRGEERLATNWKGKRSVADRSIELRKALPGRRWRWIVSWSTISARPNG